MNLIFFIIGVVLIIGGIIAISYSYSLSKYSLKANAKCIDILKSEDYECPVYEIYYEGEKREICNRKFVKCAMTQIDKEYILYVNPKNINQYKIFIDKDTNKTLYFIGFLTVVTGGISLLAAFNFSKIINFIFAMMLLFLFGIYLLIRGLKSFNSRIRVCTEKIEATVVHSDMKWIRENSEDNMPQRVFKAIYEIKYHNQTYRISNDIYSRKTKINGTTCSIKINPNNPKEFIDDIWKFHTYGMILTGIFITLGVMIYILFNIKNILI